MTEKEKSKRGLLYNANFDENSLKNVLPAKTYAINRIK